MRVEEIKKFSTKQASFFQSANKNQLSMVFPDAKFSPTNMNQNIRKQKSRVDHLISEESIDEDKKRNSQDYQHLVTVGRVKKWLFSQESRLRINWDLIIMFVAVYNCFEVPFNVAFTNKNDSNIYSDIIDLVTNVLFILDLLINFVTTYTDSDTKVEVTSYGKIAKNYLKGRFWIDLIASIPFDYIRYLDQNSDTIPFELFSLLKLVRILRLSKLITYMNIRNEVKSSLRLIKLVFFLILFLHCLGCMWFFLAKQTEEWIPPLDYVFVTTTIYSEASILQY